MTPEEKARQQIDTVLSRCGWTVQDKAQMNLHAAKGVALCELSFKSGEPDYTLFVDGKAIATVEAKPEGHSLTGVEEQSTKYVTGSSVRAAGLALAASVQLRKHRHGNPLHQSPRSRAS